ncbi:MAG: DUF547 domain-containing protein [Kiloniellales bacterium]
MRNGGPDPLRILNSRRGLLRAGLVVGLAVPLAGFRSLSGAFAPSARLWPRWQAADAASTLEPEVAAWDLLLARYLRLSDTGLAVFDYGAVTPEDRRVLRDFIGQLTAMPVSRMAPRVQLPYWVNLYNALTVDVVLAHYPVASIRDIDISPGLFADGPWDKPLTVVEDQPLTLNDIEHRILRPIWRDPRLHYVVNCASVGCPNLGATAYRADSMEQTLDEAARGYVNDPRGVTIRNGRVVVSSIYDWFIEDFGGNEASVLAHLQRYAAPALSAQLAAIGKLHDSAYDWRLNDPAQLSQG